MPNEYMSYMEEQQDLNYREAEQHQRQKLAEHEADQQTEGDLEQRQAEQEQTARLTGATAQYQEEVENMFGEEWDRQHKQYNRHQLLYMLKSSLQREQGAYIMQRVADAEITRLRAELAALLESCKNLRRAAMFAYNLTSGRDAWYDKSNEVEGESNAGVFLTIIRAEEEKLGLLL